ncbi:MAG: hypothetical protein L0154_27995 [Chloroflexi bacterium]|nr:hypothetical protein [Chloroflexota bacterium]
MGDVIRIAPDEAYHINAVIFTRNPNIEDKHVDASTVFDKVIYQRIAFCKLYNINARLCGAKGNFQYLT